VYNGEGKMMSDTGKTVCVPAARGSDVLAEISCLLFASHAAHALFARNGAFLSSFSGSFKRQDHLGVIAKGQWS
jgi:hypothetical protein